MAGRLDDGAVPERLRLHQVANRHAPEVPRRLLASWQRSEDYGPGPAGLRLAGIVRVLSRADVTMNQAARELGMSRTTLYRKLAQYGIRAR